MLTQISFLWYIAYFGLNTALFLMLQSYIKNNATPHPLLALAGIICAAFTIYLYPSSENSSDIMADFIAYAVFALIPFSQIAVISTKFITELLINNDDFDPDTRRNYLSEIKIPLDNLVSSGKHHEAIEFLQEKQLMSKFKKDYRICIEIATIAMSPIGNYELALQEYGKVLTLTKRAEAIAYSLYRMADIYMMKTETRNKAKECLERLKINFPKNEYGKSAALRLQIMEREELGLMPFDEFGEAYSKSAEQASNKPDIVSSDPQEYASQRIFGSQDTLGSIQTQRNQVSKDYQQLLQESAAQAGKNKSEEDKKRASGDNLMAAYSIVEQKRQTTAEAGSYQDLLNQSLQKTAGKRMRSGKTGHLPDLRLRKDAPLKDFSKSDVKSETGRLTPPAPISIPSDSEAYQMMLRRQGIQTLEQSEQSRNKRQGNVNITEDGITGFTRLKRQRKSNQITR